MKYTNLALALAAAMSLTGCSDLVSLHPIVTGQQALTDSNLAGTWKDSDKNLIVIQQDGSSYAITYTEGKGESLKFTATIFKSGDAELLDLVNESDTVLQVPVHAAVRVWSEGSVLRWTFLDSKWLRERAAQELVMEQTGKMHLLLSPGETVRAFLLKYGGDPQAYESEPAVLTRMAQ